MKRIKSLKPTGVAKGADDTVLSGYAHRVHRSKKGQQPFHIQRKELRRMIRERMERWDKRHNYE